MANLARSIGTSIAFRTDIVPRELQPARNIPALLGAIGLAHDLGNPPFGHQGEGSIRAWFEKNQARVFPEEAGLGPAMKKDFLNFDGNAQTFRLVSRLQILNDNFGLNLTYGTLAALLKYTVASDRADKNSSNASERKHGYFQSESDIVKEVWHETGLQSGIRHPLTFVMEACDDIAYSVLDTEDAVKKGLVSFQHVMTYLQKNAEKDPVIESVVEQSQKKHDEYRKESLSPAELNDVSMQMFRVYAIRQLVKDATAAFAQQVPSMFKGSFTDELILASPSRSLCEKLKEFARTHAFRHKSVLAIELRGHNVLMGLMDLLWEAITEREDKNDVRSRRLTPFGRYAYGRISENYRRVFESAENLPVRYREAQLLTDMISGMTDSYAISLYEELKNYHV